MAIVYRGSSTQATTAGGTTTSISTPAATQTGDLLILTALLAPNVTGPTLSGWTLVENSTDGVSDTVLAWTKTAVSGDAAGGGSYSPSWTGSAKGCFVMSAYGGVGSVDTHGIAVYAVTSSPTATASVTPTASGEVAFCYFADRESTSAAAITTGWTAGSGLTARQFVNNSASISSVWSSMQHMDTNGTVGAGALSLQATPSTSQTHSQAGLIFLIPAAAVVAIPTVPPRRSAQPMLRVRHAGTTVPPAQVFVAQPPSRRRPMPLLARRGRIAQVVPPQVVVPPPPIPPQLVREKLRWFTTRRGRVAEVVPPQVVVPPPVYVPPAVRSRGRFLPQRRPRIAVTPPAQAKPPTVARVRLRLPVVRRGRAVKVIPPQVVVVPPPYRPRSIGQKLRQLVFRRPRFTGSGWMVGAEETCTTPQPNTGTTIRPNAGTTAYGLAMTSRPNTGTTARPNTGITDDPC